MEELRAALIEFGRQVRKAFQPFFDALRRLAKRLRPWLRTLHDMQVREEWREAQQTARFLSRHPDIAESDGWLDRWYPDPAFA